MSLLDFKPMNMEEKIYTPWITSNLSFTFVSDF